VPDATALRGQPHLELRRRGEVAGRTHEAQDPSDVRLRLGDDDDRNVSDQRDERSALEHPVVAEFGSTVQRGPLRAGLTHATDAATVTFEHEDPDAA
jgi:hypothetical protein